MRELPVPPALHDEPDAVEVARLWIGRGGLHVTLNIGLYRDPEGTGEIVAWGDIFADTMRHVARGIAQQLGMHEELCLESLLAQTRSSIGRSDRPMEGGFPE